MVNRVKLYAQNTFLQSHLPSLGILTPISGKIYCLELPAEKAMLDLQLNKLITVLIGCFFLKLLNWKQENTTLKLDNDGIPT